MIKIIRENKILYSIIALVILLIVVINLPKTYSNDLYKEYTAKTNKEMKSLGKELQGIAYSFTQDKKVLDTYKNTMYDCIGYTIYNTDEEASFNTSLQTCKNDYDQGRTEIYFNHVWLVQDFSHWNGSYLPLERIIQKGIKEPKSYEHLKTTHTMHFEDERPHMFVSIDFRAANIGGYMLNRTMSVKVDAKTKELYDLK